MFPSRTVLALCALALVAALAAPSLRPARGDEAEDRARAALEGAVKRGAALWNQRAAAPGAKTCAECHGPGPNRMRAGRLKSFPKFDAASGKVITAQQKLNEMITTQAQGKALPLGSDDLNALEAYVSTLR